MIDINNERLLSLVEASRLLPGRPSAATLWRYRTKGIRGRVLASVAIGGKIFTSAEAVARFAEQRGDTQCVAQRTPTKREQAIARASAELDAALSDGSQRRLR
jgi:hypothetical protein